MNETIAKRRVKRLTMIQKFIPNVILSVWCYDDCQSVVLAACKLDEPAEAVCGIWHPCDR